MQENTSNSTEIAGRKKILLGLGILSLFPILKLSNFFSSKSKAIACSPNAGQKETMKFLTQEGKLVEVDVSKINGSKTKVSNDELKVWVKR
ncbi:MAG: hypothetical protein LBE82_12305 [Chitinophagaceae bacterium]|jgi:hypothetical protein|nr:hypothetical protein [Chitinophagaceae bacterium]